MDRGWLRLALFVGSFLDVCINSIEAVTCMGLVSTTFVCITKSVDSRISRFNHLSMKDT